MNQFELNKRVAVKTGLEEAKVASLTEALKETLVERFKRGEKVVLSEFGSFVVTSDRRIQFNPAAKVKEAVE